MTEYRWHTIRCDRCGKRHNVERPNARFCSERCSKAYRRDLAKRRAAAAECPDNLPEGTNLLDARTAPAESGSLPGFQKARIQTLGVVYARPIAGINSVGGPLVGNDSRMNGEPFTFKEDTFPGRKWRVVAGSLQCEAGGGWKDVFQVADGVELSKRLAWLAGKLRAVDARRCRSGASAARPAFAGCHQGHGRRIRTASSTTAP